MLKNRTAAGMLAVLAAVVALTGCGPASNGSVSSVDPSNKKLTINLMHIWPEGTSTQQYKLVEQIIDQYESENPAIMIKTDVLENEQYKNKLRVLAASNELPDVGVSWAAGFLDPYVKGDLFAPLDDLLDGEQLAGKFVPGTLEDFAVDNHTYALPIELNLTPIYYNKAIFAKYKLQVPQTYDEFEHVVTTLVDNGIEPIALGNKDRWTGSLWYMYLADRIAGSDILEKATNGSGSFEDPGLIQAAREIQRLVDLKAFNTGYNGLSDQEGKARFMNEKAAMYLMGTWELPNFTTNPEIPQEFKDKISFFKFPTVKGGKGNSDSWLGGPGAALFVAEDSKVKDEAKKFVEYFVAKWGEQSVRDAGVIPATKVNMQDLNLPQMYVDLLGELNKAKNFTLFADVQMKTDAAQVHLNMIQALFGKAATPEEFVRRQKAAVLASN